MSLLFRCSCSHFFTSAFWCWLLISMVTMEGWPCSWILVDTLGPVVKNLTSSSLIFLMPHWDESVFAGCLLYGKLSASAVSCSLDMFVISDNCYVIGNINVDGCSIAVLKSVSRTFNHTFIRDSFWWESPYQTWDGNGARRICWIFNF